MSPSGAPTLCGTTRSRQVGGPWARPHLTPVASARPEEAEPVMIWPAGHRTIRIALAAGEWALATPPASARQQDDNLRQELADAIRAIDPSCLPRGPHWAFTRLPSSAFSCLTGPAILHHRHGATAIYCAGAHLTDQAAHALAALAAQAMDLLRPRGICQLDVTRIGHGQLPTTLHPALMRARETEMKAYLCARHITRSLAEAIGVLSAAQAQYFVRLSAGAGRLQMVRPLETG